MSHIEGPWCSWTLSTLFLLLGSPRVEAQATPQGTTPRSGSVLGRTELFVVDDTPSSCRFSADISTAVNAASDGDVILVKSGTYASFVIDGKELNVIGEGLPTASFEVRNLPAGRSVVVRGFLGTYPKPRFTGNSGPVWVEDCTWVSNTASANALGSTVGLFRCRALDVPYSGSAGFGVVDSTLFAYHSVLEGSEGAFAYFDSGFCRQSGGFECSWQESSPGGAGVVLGAGGSAFLFGCSLTGGRGGSGSSVDCDPFPILCGAPDSLPGSCGGNALSLATSTSATVLQTQLTGGLPDCDGTAVSGSGTLTTIPGQTGEFSVGSPVQAGAPLHYRFSGPPGRNVYVTYSSTYAPVFDAEFHGMSVVPLGSPTVLAGMLPASGELEMDVSFGNLLEPGSQARVIYMQAKLYDPLSGWGVLGTPSVLVVVDDPCL